MRDFVNVADVARASVLALTSSDAVSKIINIGTGIPTSVGKVGELIGELIGRPYLMEDVGPVYGDPAGGCADVTRAVSILGFQANTKLEDGISEYVEWYKEAGAARFACAAPVKGV